MTYLFVILLVAVMGALLTVPLLPAIQEFRHKEDAEPLNVIQGHAGDIRHFAQSFAARIKELEPVLDRSQRTGEVARGVLPDGSHYCVVRDSDDLPLSRKAADVSLCPYVVAFSSNVACSGNICFTKELYARGSFSGGEHNQYRAILGVGDVTLGRCSTVLRWAHSTGEFNAGEGCNLYGRISAQQRVELKRGSRFLRLNAPRINVGSPCDRPSESIPASNGTASSQNRRTLFDGDVTIKSGEVFYGSIVARGKLHLREGAHVFGSIKSSKELIVENEVVVEGSVMCADRMIVGSRCTLHGPIIAERSLVLYSETICGSLHRPTTVSSPEIQVQEGLVVFGTLWARESGSVWGRA